MTTNERLLEAAIDHQVYVEQYKKAVLEQITRKLRGTARDLTGTIRKTPDGPTRTRLVALNREVTRLVDQYYAGVKDYLIGNEARSFAATVARMTYRGLGDSIPIAVSLVQPSPEQVFAAATRKTFDGLTVSELIGEQQKKVVDRFARTIKQTYIEGAGSAEAARRVLGTVTDNLRSPEARAWRNSVRALTRTGIQNLATAARDKVYSDNEDLIKGIEWVSTLDGRTSPVCQARDGQVYPVDEGPRPPAHWNCRSTTVPVVKSWRELGVDIDEAPEGTRASMDGQVAAGKSYEDWLRGLPEARQREILGATKYELFKGGTPLTKFVSDDAVPLTVAQIRERFGMDNTSDTQVPEDQTIAGRRASIRQRYKESGDRERYLDDILALGADIDEQMKDAVRSSQREISRAKLRGLNLSREIKKREKFIDEWEGTTNQRLFKLLVSKKITAERFNIAADRIKPRAARYRNRVIAPLYDERFAANQQLAKLRGDHKDVTRKSLDDIIGLLPEGESLMTTVPVSGTTQEAMATHAASGFRWYPRHFKEFDNGNHVGFSVQYERARYDWAGRVLYVEPNAGCVVHEMGHWVEHMNRDILELQEAFYERRTKGEAPELLKKLTGIDRFEDYEIAREDLFFKAYCGKDYREAYYGENKHWELFTMGFEDLISGNGRADDEYRQFVLGILGGL